MIAINANWDYLCFGKTFEIFKNLQNIDMSLFFSYGLWIEQATVMAILISSDNNVDEMAKFMIWKQLFIYVIRTKALTLVLSKI